MSEVIKQFLQQANPSRTRILKTVYFDCYDMELHTDEDGDKLYLFDNINGHIGNPETSTDPALINEFNSLFSNTNERVKAAIEEIRKATGIDEGFYYGLDHAISIIKKHFSQG